MTRAYRRGLTRVGQYDELSDDELLELQTGWGLLSPFHNSLELLRAAWERHGQKITSNWIRDFPGSRPFCWYLFVGYPQFGERRTTKYYARLAPYRDAWLRWGILNVDLLPPVLEGQPEYLARTGQLTDPERTALGEIVSAVQAFEASYPQLAERICQAMQRESATSDVS